jgi:hypothetical protein
VALWEMVISVANTKQDRLEILYDVWNKAQKFLKQNQIPFPCCVKINQASIILVWEIDTVITHDEHYCDVVEAIIAIDGSVFVNLHDEYRQEHYSNVLNFNFIDKNSIEESNSK